MVMLLEMFVRMMVMGLWKHGARTIFASIPIRVLRTHRPPSECAPGELLTPQASIKEGTFRLLGTAKQEFRLDPRPGFFRVPWHVLDFAWHSEHRPSCRHVQTCPDRRSGVGLGFIGAEGDLPWWFDLLDGGILRPEPGVFQSFITASLAPP